MKLIVTVLGLFCLVVLTNKFSPAEALKHSHRRHAEMTTRDRGNVVQIRWIVQRLDHFDTRNNSTWLMRYMVNAEHFAIGGPMFILVGGYGPISANAIQSGIFYDSAKEQKAILFHTEHRYYGESNPTSDLSIENLKYLHTKQALADLALFIRTLRTTDSRLATSKVIIAGSSYAGSLVVWFSRLYPDLVDGGWASSAPILAQVDFKEYNEIAGKSFRALGSQQCYNRIQNGIAELEAMFADNRWADAKSMLLLCDSFDHRNDLDLWSLFYAIADAFTDATILQTGVDIHGACNYIMNFEDDLTAVVAVFIVKNFVGQDCVDMTYESSLKSATDLTPRSVNPRPWFYQLCNEFGWFKTTTSRRQPFGSKVPATLLTTMCYDAFGPVYTYDHIQESVAETNKFFGGMKPDVKNIYMTHGALDPWSPLGHNKAQGASVLPRASHCSDLGSISIVDSLEMRASKQRLIDSVRKWLA